MGCEGSRRALLVTCAGDLGVRVEGGSGLRWSVSVRCDRRTAGRRPMADNDAAVDPTAIDLDAVQSFGACARACDRLRAERSYSDMRKAVKPRSLPAATLSDLLNAKGTPTLDTVI